MRTLRIPAPDGVELHVLADDCGPVGADTGVAGVAGGRFLLVHGLASNARLWDGVRAALVARGAAVAAVDLRGHGLSDKPDDGYDFGTVATDVLAVIDGLGWDSCVLAGQSWGGNVVLEVGARHPDRVDAVVCVDGGWIDLSKAGPWEEVRERMAPPKTEGTPFATIERYMRRAHPDWPESGIQGALACFEVRADGTVAPWLTRDRHLRILRHLWEHDPSQVYPQVRMPVVLVPCDDGSGWADRKKHQVAEAERLLPRSRTVWFRADHDVHAQRPEDIAELLIETAAA